MFRRGKISEYATASARHMDVIIPTPLGLILSGSMIQELFVFRLITTIGVLQARPLPIMRLLTALLEEEALKAVACLLYIR